MIVSVSFVLACKSIFYNNTVVKDMLCVCRPCRE